MRSIPLACHVAALLALGLSLAEPARAGSASQERIAPDLACRIHANPKSQQTVRVIVQFSHPGVDGDVVSRKHGGQAKSKHGLINGATLDLPQNAVAALSQDPDVAWVSPDRSLSAQWDYDTQTVGADQVWNSPGLQGTGVGVAVLDTGVTPGSADFCRSGSSTCRVLAFKDFVNNQSSAYDDNGHGTHVAGIVLSSGNCSNGLITGEAPDASLVAVKVLDQNGAGSVSTVIAGLNWCVQNKNAYNLRVVNLSLGHDIAESCATDPLCVAVRNAVRSGLVVVCAGGNKGKNSQGQIVYGGIESPGNEPSAITVGALNTHQSPDRSGDSVCTYSSRGPTYIDHLRKPDLLAPGNKINSVRSPSSVLDRAYPGNHICASNGLPKSNGTYFQLSGTSMATPQVAGAVALMLQANPGLGPESVKGILMYSALPLKLTDALGIPLTQGLSNLTQGAGCLNAAGAVEVATKVNAAAPVGSSWLLAALSKQTTISGTSYAWGQSVLWGDTVLWGDALLGTRQVLWGDTCLWSDSVLWGDSVLWADNGVAADQTTWNSSVLWGDTVLWGDSCLWGDAMTGIMINGE